MMRNVSSKYNEMLYSSTDDRAADIDCFVETLIRIRRDHAVKQIKVEHYIDEHTHTHKYIYYDISFIN